MLNKRIYEEGSGERAPWVYAAALFALNLGVIWPYLSLAISSHAWGNDFAYMGVARLFREQPWTWNALQYCGAPFRYLYPPLFHAAAAILPVGIGRAFHLCGGCAYALIPVALYFAALQMGRSPRWALWGSVWYSLIASPIYLALPAWRSAGRGANFAPLNLIGITRFDEAPHYLAFALGLLAIGSGWRNRPRLAWGCGAAALLTNLPGAVGLAMMIAAFGIARRSARAAFVFGGMAFGLAAFWITPGFGVAMALTNRALLGSAAGRWDGRAAAIIAGAVLLLGASCWNRLRPGLRFAAAWIAICGAVVVLFAVCGISVTPLANRYALEWNAALVLGATLLLSSGAGRWRAISAALLLGGGAWVTRGFLLHPWKDQAEPGNPRNMASFQAAQWLLKNAPSARALASGEMENALDAWGSVRQAGGSFTGMSNLTAVAAANRMQGSCDAPGIEKEVAGLWLRALEVRYVIVNQANSAEAFHWMAHPEVFADLRRVWENGRGDEIAEVPENGGEAVVVDVRALERLPKFSGVGDVTFLRAYADWARGLRPAGLRWETNDRARLIADAGPGEALLVKTSFDPGWRSSLGRVEADPIGFLLIKPQPGRAAGSLEFRASWDVWLGVLITLGTLLCLPWEKAWPWAAGVTILLWGGSFLVLERQGSAGVRVAEREFQDNRLPLISRGGIADAGRAISIYGTNFGDERARVRVFQGGREAKVLFHDSNQVNIEGVPGVSDDAPVTVEVNGCRGNAFPLHAKFPASPERP